MIIEDKEELSKKGGKKGLNAVERYIMDIEEGQSRIITLLNLADNKQARIELSELRGYGTKASKSNSTATSLNRIFIVGELPLIAISRKDRVIVQKMEQHKTDAYGKVDKKEMSKEHTELIKNELEKLKVISLVKEEKPKKHKS